MTKAGTSGKNSIRRDSAGVLFLRLLNIPTAIITGEDTEIVRRRAQKLKIPHLFMGVKNKLKVARELCADLGISLENVAYIGDDINDIILLRAVGLSACPANAPEYIQSEVDWKIPVKGGDGAFRGFVEQYLNQSDQLAEAIELYLTHISDNP